MEQSQPLKALAWMIGAAVSFTAMAVAGRELQAGMNTFEVMLYRSVIGFAVVAAVIACSRSGFAQVRTRHWPLHLKRNAFHFTGQNLWFFAVAQIPLSQLVALEFTNPLWVALLAPFLLGERLTAARLFAALIGFAGVIVVAEPGVSPFEIGHAAALVAAVFFALNSIFTREIMGHDGVLCVLFWMTLLQALAGLVLALPGGIPPPTGSNLPWMLVVGITGLSAHYCLTAALGFAPVTIVAPMDFMRLPFVAVTGMLLYGETIHMTVLFGAVLIIGGNFVNLWSGSDRARN
jgi:drug/metabolite transporter (DMT)-like permease